MRNSLLATNTVLVLLSVSGGLVELADDEGRSAGNDFHLFHDETTSHITVAWRFTTVSLTVIFRPFQSMVAFWISSPTFVGAYPVKGGKENANHTERTNLGGKSSGRSTFTTDSTEIN